MKNLLGVFIKGGVVSAVGLVITGVAQVLLNIIVARFYSSTELGLFASFYAFVAVMAVLVSFGGRDAILKFGVEHKDALSLEGQSVLIRALYVSAICFVCCWGLLHLLQALQIDVIPDMGIEYLLLFAAFFAILNLVSAYYQSIKNMLLTIFYKEMSRYGVFIILAMLGVLFNIKSFYDNIHYTLIPFLGLIMIGLYPLLRGKKRDVSADKTFNKEYLNYALYAFLVELTQVAFMWSDVIILERFVDADKVGMYFAAARLAIVISIMLGAINMIFTPIISQLWRNRDLEQLESIFRMSIKFSMVFVGIFLVLGTVYSAEIMALFGREFTAAKYVLVFVLIGRAFNAITGSVSRVLMMTGGETTEFYINTGSIVILLCFLFYMVPEFGILGAAISICLLLILANSLKMYFVYKRLEIFPYDKDALKWIALVVVLWLMSSALCHYWNTLGLTPLANMSLTSVIIIGIYSFVVIRINMFNIRANELMGLFKLTS